MIDSHNEIPRVPLPRLRFLAGAVLFCAGRTALCALFLSLTSCNVFFSSLKSVETLVVEANRLGSQGSAAAKEQAIAGYKRALSLPKPLLAKETADIHKRIGDLYSELGNFQEAHCQYSLALQYVPGDAPLCIEIRNQLANAAIRLNRFDEASAHLDEAEGECRRLNDPAGLAQVEFNRGEIQYWKGESEPARALYASSLNRWRALDDARGQAEALLSIGSIHSESGETKEAFECFKQALKHFQSIQNEHGHAIGLIAIAHLQAKVGEKEEALRLYEQSLDIVKKYGDRYWEASIYIGIGFVLQSSGQQLAAGTFYDHALSIYRKLDLINDEANVLFIKAGLEEETESALESFHHLLTLSQSLKDKKLEAIALQKIAVLHNLRGDMKGSLECLERALLLSRTSSAKRTELAVLNTIGHLYKKLGEKPRAREYYQQALLLSRKSNRAGEAAQSLFHMAKVEMEMGQLSQAQSSIDAAIAEAESLRAKVDAADLQSSYFASIFQYFELKIRLLMLLHEKAPGKGYDVLAFLQNERARARSLIDQMIRSRADLAQAGDPQLTARLNQIRDRINRKAEDRMWRLQAGSPDGEIIALSQEITELAIERNQVEAQIRSAAPKPAPASSASVEEIQRTLDRDTQLLEFALGEEKSYLWLVTQDRIRCFPLPARGVIEASARRLQTVLKTFGPPEGQSTADLIRDYTREAAALSRLLLAPAAEQLNKRRLLIVADGVLQLIPFQALLKPVPDNAASWHPMMLAHQITNLPSASTLVAMRRDQTRRSPAPKSIAIIADPVYENDDYRFLQKSETLALNKPATISTRGKGGVFQRLHFTEEEAEAIRLRTRPEDRLELTGFLATRDAILKQDLSQFRTLHFATHGDVDNEQPELSSIVLSLYDANGHRQNGLLRLQDIYTLRLNADLVVLSACETALGKDLRGEGLIGLTRGFMYAGASRVMASLWKVSDRSTAELMKRFYQYHLKEGLPPAAALQKAQLTMWQQPEWRPPYHWAGFVLQGEYK